MLYSIHSFYHHPKKEGIGMTMSIIQYILKLNNGTILSASWGRWSETSCDSNRKGKEREFTCSHPFSSTCLACGTGGTLELHPDIGILIFC